ncbi:MAG: DUF2249 domain-containing protein [Planctomycetes bacterium]|nr:DUF2249 domain-containing protein [Planctomycetota bacterium]
MTQTAGRELDVRALPPAERHPKIFALFDSLAEGDSFVLINDHDPRPLFHQFRMERAGTVQWVPISEGPGEWRIEITRLRPWEEETEIEAAFGRDHDEIDLLLGYLRQDLQSVIGDKKRSAGSLGRQFDEFDGRLERHIRWEEEILFPAAEVLQPFLAQGPGRVMRMEHEEIRRLKAEVGRCLHTKEASAAAVERTREALEALVSLLTDHNHKEESIYYPASEQVLDGGKKADLLRRVREAYRP